MDPDLLPGPERPDAISRRVGAGQSITDPYLVLVRFMANGRYHPAKNRATLRYYLVVSMHTWTRTLHWPRLYVQFVCPQLSTDIFGLSKRNVSLHAPFDRI